MKVLVDEMYDGIEIKLKELGYDASSVKKLIQDGKKMKSDYSVIKYAEQNDMVLVTEDVQNAEGCRENNIKCVVVDKNQVVKMIVEELEKIKSPST